MTTGCRPSHQSAAGSAILIALVVSMLLAALGLSVVTTTTLERVIADHHRVMNTGFHGAEAGLDRALLDLAAASDWTDILKGIRTPTWTGGPPLAGLGEPPKSLAQLTGDLQAASDAASPWGSNNPRWRLFVRGPVSDLVGGSSDDEGFVVTWVADDPSESDGDPSADGNGTINVAAVLFGARGLVRRVDATVARGPAIAPGRVSIRVVSWREVR